MTDREELNTVRSSGHLNYPDLGYFVTYAVYDYRLEVVVYERFYLEPDNLGVVSKSISWPTTDLDDAEKFAAGEIKWDGCSNWDFQPEKNHWSHFCSRRDLLEFGELLSRLWDEAMRLVPHASYDPGGKME